MITLTQLGLITLLLWPRPSWPHSLLPKVNNRPDLKYYYYLDFLDDDNDNDYNNDDDDDLVTTAVCSSPQAMMVISSFLIQNLLGAFSANLDLPKVNTAPVSGISGSSISTLIGQ